MNQELLCSWLSLPGSTWPPDPYALLGVAPGETDLQKIERHVHDRLAKLRCYQLAHPEEATEGMNRLAQAFICVSEAANKAAAASAHAAAPKAAKPRIHDDTAILQKTTLDWRTAAPPVRGAAAPAKMGDSASVLVAKPLVAPPAPPDAAEQAAALAAELARSPEASAGLATLADVVMRVEQTRSLLTAWLAVGTQLHRPIRKPPTAVERALFAHQLATIRAVTDTYPAFVGQPGKPGYRVAALARLAMTYDMFKNMDPRQREDLLRDWDTARRVLLEHRKYLRRQFASLRHKGLLGRVLRFVRTTVTDHPYLSGAVATALLGLSAYAMWGV